MRTFIRIILSIVILLSTSAIGSIIALSCGILEQWYGFGLLTLLVGGVSGLILRVMLNVTEPKKPNSKTVKLSDIVDSMPPPHWAESEHYACGDRD